MQEPPLKRLFAILMLSVQLFNLFGYRYLFNYQIHQSNIEATAQADAATYQDEELIEMKVRLNLPYMSDWPDYERFEGTLEIDGVFYNYVKRKIVNDTLYILCMRDHLATNLSQQKTKFGIEASDLPGDKSDQSTPVKKDITTQDFTITQHPYHLTNVPVIPEITTTHHVASKLNSGYATLPVQPPRTSLA